LNCLTFTSITSHVVGIRDPKTMSSDKVPATGRTCLPLHLPADLVLLETAEQYQAMVEPAKAEQNQASVSCFPL